jgi:hypothetical protein
MLPNTLNTDLSFLCSSITSDSVASIDVGPTILAAPPDIQASYSRFSQQESFTSLLLPHWMIQFKSQTNTGLESLRLIQIALVPALYQRRAIGYPDHFVFGT